MNPWDKLLLRRESCQRLLGCRGEHELAQWLSTGEREVLAQQREPSRRRAWLSGRLLLKQLILSALDHTQTEDARPEPGEIEIHSLDVLGRPTRPRVTVRGRLQPWTVSIAHTERSALAALSFASQLSVGVDVTGVGPSSAGFRKLWLTSLERRWYEQSSDPFLVPTLWAIKEAMYKAVNFGESFAPRRIEVTLDGASGVTCSCKDGRSRQPPRVRVDFEAGEITAIVAICAAGSETTP